ncbi:hypothetical protein PENSPDRAFT_694547 [Peniophora sp. CONT]|nr:hypothetical protein PENSPDRAFT_694547 [Peniophora sp. CONT]
MAATMRQLAGMVTIKRHLNTLAPPAPADVALPSSVYPLKGGLDQSRRMLCNHGWLATSFDFSIGGGRHFVCAGRVQGATRPILDGLDCGFYADVREHGSLRPPVLYLNTRWDETSWWGFNAPGDQDIARRAAYLQGRPSVLNDPAPMILQDLRLQTGPRIVGPSG